MRDDYWSMTEFTRLLHMSHSAFHKLRRKPDAFAAYQVGLKWVIPKAAFFRWFFQMCALGRAVEFFDGNAYIGDLKAERDRWLHRRAEQKETGIRLKKRRYAV